MNPISSYIVYCITNLINNKIYIGRTTESIEKRWYNHKFSINSSKNKHLRLYRAFKKYGIDNFEIEIIDYAIDFEELKKLEGCYIISLETWKDNIGYNMSIDTDKGLELLDDISKARRGESIHKVLVNRKLSKNGIGIRKHGKLGWAANLRHKGKVYYVPFLNLEEAKIAYDKLSLYFYNDISIINYPDQIYSKQELDENFLVFHQKVIKSKTSKYRGVYRAGKNFASHFNFNKSSYYLGRFNTEELAAQAYDKKAIELLGSKAKTNFPMENYS